MNLDTPYAGDITVMHINNSQCPEFENNSVHIENIPPTARLKEIFARFREGKVFQSSLMEPKDNRKTCAADVRFFTRGAAEMYIARSDILGIWIGQNELSVSWNRSRSAAPQEYEMDQSRVLHIEMPQGWFEVADLPR